MRKSKVVTRKRRSSPTRAVPKKNASEHLKDRLGIVLIALCPVLLIALIAPAGSGFFGGGISAALKVAFGIGSYFVPVLLALSGIMLIMKPNNSVPAHVTVGGSILLVAILGFASCFVGPSSGMPAAGGGYIGFVLAVGLQKATGLTIPYIILTATALYAVAYMIDQPLADLFARMRFPASCNDGAQEPKKSRLKRQSAKLHEETEPKVKSSRRLLDRLLHTNNPATETAIVPAEEPLPKRVPVKINGVNNKPKTKPESAPVPAQTNQEGEYQLPPSTLLDPPQPPPLRVDAELKNNIQIIERTLSEFNVQANVVEIAVGPTVARYEIQLAPGIKVSRINQLADNLAMQLAAHSVRVEAPIPGKAAIGVEVPNLTRGLVGLRELIESKEYKEGKPKLTFALGKDVAGNCCVASLEKMPHMLVGGATNAGKSVCLNTLITSLLFRATPDELKFVMIDPKRVELSLFEGIPHLAYPVVKDVKLAAGILRAVAQEMERRYQVFERVSVRNLAGYNQKVPAEERLPFMVVVVDELCDLMMQCAAEVEGTITRLAQLARATGIHLVLATQRPSVDVITGVIKANISSRIAFAVSSHHDSRTILDTKGAETLLGSGDMLFRPIDANKPTRIQGCYVSEREVETLVNFVKEQRAPAYTLTPSSIGGEGGMNGEDDKSFTDEYYEPSVRFVASTGYCSTSTLQRKFKIGYTRAARIVDAMEMQGIVGAQDGAKPRQVLIGKYDIDLILSGQRDMSYGLDLEEDDYVPTPIVDEVEEEES